MPSNGIINKLFIGVVVNRWAGIKIAKNSLTDEEIVATIFHKLARRNLIGENYKPYDSVKGWIEGRIKRDGVRVNKIMDDLVKSGYLRTKKGGDVVSLNPKRMKEIEEVIDKILS